MTKYHIDSNGAPAVCKATKRPCPRGGADGTENHFDTLEEAQKRCDEINSRENGIFNEIKVVKANSEEDQIHLEKRLQFYKDLESRTGRKTYCSKCKSSEEISNFEPNKETTGHYIEDRQLKNQMIEEQVGVGSIIGTFKINHPVGGRHKDQIVSVYDNGQIKLYDIDTKRLITTYIPTKTRMETILLKAGYIPNKEWLNEVEKQKEIFDPKWEPIENEQKAKAAEKRRVEREERASRSEERKTSINSKTPRNPNPDKRNNYRNLINNGNKSNKRESNRDGSRNSNNSGKKNSNNQKRNNYSEKGDKNSTKNGNSKQETNKPKESPKSKLPQYNKNGFRIV